MASTGINLELHDLNGTPDNRVQEVQFGLNLKGAGRVEGCSALGGCYLKNRKRGPLDVRLGLEPVSDDEEDYIIVKFCNEKREMIIPTSDIPNDRPLQETAEERYQDPEARAATAASNWKQKKIIATKRWGIRAKWPETCDCSDNIAADQDETYFLRFCEDDVELIIKKSELNGRSMEEVAMQYYNGDEHTRNNIGTTKVLEGGPLKDHPRGKMWYLKEELKNLNPEQKAERLAEKEEKYPQMVAKVKEDQAVLDNPPPAPAWCKCRFCKEMARPTERLCCRSTPGGCLAQLDKLQNVIFNPVVVQVATRSNNAMLSRDDSEYDDNALRHTSYRQFLLMQYQTHRHVANKAVIPSCMLAAIRKMYPSDDCRYTGFSRFSEV